MDTKKSYLTASNSELESYLTASNSELEITMWRNDARLFGDTGYWTGYTNEKQPRQHNTVPSIEVSTIGPHLSSVGVTTSGAMGANQQRLGSDGSESAAPRERWERISSAATAESRWARSRCPNVSDPQPILYHTCPYCPLPRRRLCYSVRHPPNVTSPCPSHPARPYPVPTPSHPVPSFPMASSGTNRSLCSETSALSTRSLYLAGIRSVSLCTGE